MKTRLQVDCLVVGGGISGMESAITLGDMGFDVLLVEKEASIGGKMILLSKVFPTLDCSSCISTPKMASTYNHPKVTSFTYSEVRSIKRGPNGAFEAKVIKRPTFVDPERCTGCGQCEKVCTVARPDQFNDGLIARRAIYIPFPQAVPKKAVVEKKGVSPCTRSCPAGISVHGMVALVRNGRFDRAYSRHLEDAPFVGSLGHLCPAYCEMKCTQGKKSKIPVGIKGIERALGYWHLKNSVNETPPKSGEKRFGIVGVGPLALSLAYFLAQKGVRPLIFTQGKRLGGSLLDAVEKGLLPKEILEDDINTILAQGVEQKDSPEKTPFDALLEQNGLEGLFIEDPVRAKESEGERIFSSPLKLDEPHLLPHIIGVARKISVAIEKFLEKGEYSLPEDAFKGLEGEISIPEPQGHNEELLPEEAQGLASRCLDCAVCSQCHECMKACPANAIDFSMEPEEVSVTTKTIIIATGFSLFDPSKKPLLGYDRLPNVITAMQMDRLLAPTRPYNAVLRPSDGKVPGNIAIVLCAGSRDRTAGNTWCSRICCMYSIKQAQLIMGALPIANVTIYYIDIRAFGKGYEEFFQQAKAMGTNFVKGKVARIEPTTNDDLYIYYEDMERKGGLRRQKHDLVVLAVGAMASPQLRKAFMGDDAPDVDEMAFFSQSKGLSEPGVTNIEGVFVAGSATGPRDIPDCVVHANACAAQVASYLKKTEKG